MLVIDSRESYGLIIILLQDDDMDFTEKVHSNDEQRATHIFKRS